MQATIKLAEFKPAYKNDKGKTVPPKAVDGNGVDYVVDRPLVDFVAAHIGQPLEIEFQEKQNGNYTNRYLLSAVEPKAPAQSGWQPRSPEERREIIRQTALKASVEMYAALYNGKGKDSGLTTKPILKMAELFADWVTRLGTDPEGPVDEVPW